MDNFRAIREKAVIVRDLVGRKGPFGLGMRLGERAVRELGRSQKMDEFRRFIDKENLYVFTINGFPQGRFHGTSSREDIYIQDWRGRKRLDYTIRLAKVLAALLPAGLQGSVSTPPPAYRGWARYEEDRSTMTCFLAEAALQLHELAQQGKNIVLALEPEPDCLIETVDQLVDFLKGQMQMAVDHLCKRKKVSAETAEQVWRKYIGACVDTAHVAVEFEDPVDALRRLQQAGVPLGKVHLGSALHLTPTPQVRRRLRQFCDRSYMHQVRARRPDGTILSYPDLSVALEAAKRSNPANEEWRIHFHIPMFFKPNNGMQSTSSLLKGKFAQMLREGATSHVEIETYTFKILPKALQPVDVTAGVAEEYRWVLKNMFPKSK